MKRGTAVVRVVVALFVMLVPAIALAQSAIAGVVRDTTGAVLPGVTVEAASPALIEKVRTVITDSQGEYKIIDLRPGTYTVKFTLVGFNTVRRDGLELTANFTASVNADLRVGTVQETVTVLGQSPVVDVQNVVQQRVVTAAVIAAAPTARTFQNFAQLIPGVTLANVLRPAAQDVGGLSGNRQRILIHGSRFNDFSQTLEGLSFNILNSAGSSSSITPNPAEVQEYSYELGAISAEVEKGGARVNIIPKEGGNRFAGSTFATFDNSKLQNDNITDDLKARGAGSGNPLDKTWDVSAALGGALKQDRLWFFGAYRHSGLYNLVSGVYYNADPKSFLYTPDLSRPAIDNTWNHSEGLRLTWQATPKNKFSLYGLHQYECQCHTQSASSPPRSPEGTQVQAFPVNQLMQTSWSLPATSRLLFQAGALVYRQHLDAVPTEPYVTPDTVGVTELSTGLQYRAFPTYNYTHHKQETYRASLNYVTGSHAFKTGLTLQRGERSTRAFVNRDLSFQFLNGAPRSVTVYATPYMNTEHLDADFGLYAQDQWTTRRLTLTLGVRFDQIKASVPAQHEPAGQFVAQRDFVAVPDVPNWKNVSPRLGASYDLFGRGKTAVKVSLNRYVLGELLDFAAANNPVVTSVNSASRTWTDSNGNFNPECNFFDPAANGECGGLSNVNFGKPNVTTRYDDALKTGWGVRGYNWETTAGVQQELRAGVSATATYVRRWYGNFTVTDNLAVTPADYDPFCITAPLDPRLPGGGGNQICGWYDVNPSKFGQSNNLVTFAKTYGEQTEIYNGVDINVTARLPRGVFLQGGMNAGRTATSNCFVVDSPQQLQFCDVKPPFQPQIKALGVYPLPWDLQTSATFQTAPGPQIGASYVATSAQVRSSLGRNLSSGANGTATVQLVEPGTLYGERMYQVDARLTKIFKLGRMKTQVNVDVYNALNASPVLTVNSTFGPAWQRPTYILPGRLLKFSAQVDF